MWPVHANNEATLLKHSFSNFYGIIDPNNMGVDETTKALDIHLFSVAINEKGVLKYTPFRGGGGSNYITRSHSERNRKTFFRLRWVSCRKAAYHTLSINRLWVQPAYQNYGKLWVWFEYLYVAYTAQKGFKDIPKSIVVSCLWLEHAFGYIARDWASWWVVELNVQQMVARTTLAIHDCGECFSTLETLFAVGVIARGFISQRQHLAHYRNANGNH